MSTEHNQVFSASGACCCPGCVAAAAAADALKAADANAAAAASNPPASSSATPYYVDALVNEYHYQWGSTTPGTGATITYSFLDHAPSYYASNAPESASFAPMTAAQEDAVRSVLQMYSAVANVHFVEVSGVGSITFGTADLGAGVAGWTYYPYPGYSGPSDNTAFGDVWITDRYTNYENPTFGTATFTALIHEIGHALGLKHPGDYNAGGGGTPGPYLPAAEDNQQFSVMSYYSGANGSATPTTPQLYDIAALQYLYGANTATHTGADTYTFSTSVQVETVWDAGGTDTFDASNQLQAVSIDLHPGSFSSIAGSNNVAIALGSTIEIAIGSNYNDTLTANDSGCTLRGGLGDDTLIGGAASDVLIGGAGSDTLTGGGGADCFVFDTTPNGQDVDLIRDYDHGGQPTFNVAEGDKIDLSNLLSAQYAGGHGQEAGALVRAVEDANGNVALLQVDLDGAAGNADWTTVARLDGIAVGDSLSVILDSSLPALTVVVGHALAAPGSDQPPSDPGNAIVGDGKNDILWHNVNGATSLWQMSGNQVISAQTVATVSTDWHVAAATDFGGDGNADIFWRNDSGALSEWQMNGSQIASAKTFASISSDWHLQSTSDFNGDGIGDIFWRNDNGAVSLWQMNGTQVTSASTFGTVGTDWHVQTTADFNGDGKADILWRNNNGALSEWQMNGSQVTSSQTIAKVSNDWHVLAAADFTGDGKADILWHNDNGALSLWQMNGNQVISAQTIGSIGTDWHVESTADFNGDGKADILWHNDNGALSLWQMNGAQVTSAQHIDTVSTTWQIFNQHFDLI